MVGRIAIIGKARMNSSSNHRRGCGILIAVPIHGHRRHRDRACAGRVGPPAQLIVAGPRDHRGIVLQRQRRSRIEGQRRVIYARSGQCRCPCLHLISFDILPFQDLCTCGVHGEHGIAGVNAGTEDEVHFLKAIDRRCGIAARRDL